MDPRLNYNLVISNTSITVSFKAPEAYDLPVTEYKYVACPTGTDGEIDVPCQGPELHGPVYPPTGADYGTLDLSGLDAGTDYKIKVAAYNGEWGLYSDWFFVHTAAKPERCCGTFEGLYPSPPRTLQAPAARSERM